MNENTSATAGITEAEKKRKKAFLDQIKAFKAVYGEEGKRTAAQKKVWGSMISNLQNVARNIDPITVQTNEGMRQYIKNVKDLVECPNNPDAMELLYAQRRG